MVRANNEHRQLRGSLSGIRGGSVENWCARWSRRDRWPRSRPHLEPLGGAAERASRPARRSETVLRALQKDLPGTIWEPSRDQLLEVSQIFLGRLRAAKTTTFCFGSEMQLFDKMLHPWALSPSRPRRAAPALVWGALCRNRRAIASGSWHSWPDWVSLLLTESSACCGLRWPS